MRAQRGFSLFEFAIVIALATVGAALVFGLSRGSREAQTLQETGARIQAIVQAAERLDRRSYPADTAITADLFTQDLLPNSWAVTPGPRILAPWGATMTAAFSSLGTGASVAPYVQISLVGVPTALCQTLVAQQRDPSVRIRTIVGGTVYKDFNVVPTAANLTTLCSQAPGDTIELSLPLTAPL